MRRCGPSGHPAEYNILVLSIDDIVLMGSDKTEETPGVDRCLCKTYVLQRVGDKAYKESGEICRVQRFGTC